MQGKRFSFQNTVRYEKNKEAFFALASAGLWEKEIQLLQYGEIDFVEVLRLAEEQSVVGLVAAGLEHVADMKPRKQDVLQFIGQAMQLERRNRAMNYFIEGLVGKMREAGIETLLVKGQGVAQCYERPLWRSCGDVDFFLSDENYKNAKEYLRSLASSIETEETKSMHLGMTIGPWVVELHGRLLTGLSPRIDRGIDDIQRLVLCGEDVRSWMNGSTQVLLPGVNCDILFIFTHFFKHFYKGGLGLRQICDWCRLLWTFRDVIDHNLLERRLRTMGLVNEWKAFGAFSVEYLGMPAEAMPLINDIGALNLGLRKMAESISDFVMEVGNFGQKRDRSYFVKYPYVVRKTISLGRRCGDLWRHARIFPLNSIRFLPSIVLNGLRAAARGV